MSRDEIKYINKQKRDAYLGEKETIYEVKLPNNFEGVLSFLPNCTYVVNLPKETGESMLYFNNSTVILMGKERGSLKPLNDIYIDCQNCIIDLKYGIYGIPSHIMADDITIKNANYKNTYYEPYTIDQKNEVYRRTLNSILKTQGNLRLVSSKIDFGPDNLNITPDTFGLFDSQLTLPSSYSNINCNFLTMNNSLIDAPKCDLNIKTKIAALTNSKIMAHYTSNLDIDNYALTMGSEFILTNSKVKTR